MLAPAGRHVCCLYLIRLDTYRPYGTKTGAWRRCYKHVVPMGLRQVRGGVFSPVRAVCV